MTVGLNIGWQSRNATAGGAKDARKGWDAARGQILGVGLRIRCTKTGTNEQTTIVDVVCAEGKDAAVRIGPPARKRGVSDADIWHAVRTAIRKIDMDDDLTMLIGPARDGASLEIGVLDLTSEDPVVIHAIQLRSKFYPLIGQG